MTRSAKGPSHEVLGVVAVVDRFGSSDALAWASDWAVQSGQQLTLLRPSMGDPTPLVEWAGLRASSVVLDAAVAARMAARKAAPAHPSCPLLVVPEGRPEPAQDAPVVLAIGGCERCAIPMGFACAYAQQVRAPLQVTTIAEVPDGDALNRVGSLVSMFAGCYPDLEVTFPNCCGSAKLTLAAHARLVVAGIEPSRRPLQLLADVRSPLALVPLAA